MGRKDWERDRFPSYDREAYINRSSRGSWWGENKWKVLTPLIIVGIIGVIYGIIAFFVCIMFDSGAVAWRDFVANFWVSMLFPNGANIFMATPFFWFIVAVALIVVLLVSAYRRERWAVRGVAAILIAVAWIVVLIRGSWPIEENGARYYLSTSTFYVHDEDVLPSTLVDLRNEIDMVDGTPDESMVGIEEGDMPTEWVPRVASLNGAIIVMKRNGDGINNTELMGETLTYLYGEGDDGAWTGIRNGINLQSIYGIQSWSGVGGDVTTCRFTGEYQLDQAFNGQWPDHNLYNTVAETYPAFLYNGSDIWGYCDGDEPIIVIPGVNTRGYDLRTVDETAGVVTIQGSASGVPVMKLHTQIEPGDFPGPVYPQRLVDQQRESLDWAAGRHLNWFKRFGFNTTSVESQTGNASNYLLKSKEDGRLYWVTPMTPQSTDSQTLVAYSMIPADELSAGVLNDQAVYVLSDDDSRLANLDTLLARVTSAVQEANPGFFTGNNPGQIVEFLPVSATEWQVYAELNGYVKYRIDVNVNDQIVPTVIDLDLGTEVTAPGSSEDGPTCDDPSSLSDPQLAACLVQLTQELQERQGAAANG